MDLSILLAIVCALSWKLGTSAKQPEPGECVESFIDVYPPQIMETWYVMKHTDSLEVAPTPDCLIIKFGRRMSFNSEIRIDVIYSKEGSANAAEVPFFRGEVNVRGKDPFGVDIPLSPRFPLNIMLSDFDEDNGCMAFWSCANIGSSMVQKGGWVMCQSLEVDEEVIEKLTENLVNISNMTANDFGWTKYDSCL
ncbi:hypothetical protein HNY73_019477 [Argiope bruennichi]|uniref:Uncharacterized protein n=2 Tax=Argiope bruennichi TaxID=94029 RepID=A0A8T0E669_ARGBR|nr:hypothetical protein HNY73_019477 [Argiope bruennichi]